MIELVGYVWEVGLVTVTECIVILEISFCSCLRLGESFQWQLLEGSVRFKILRRNKNGRKVPLKEVMVGPLSPIHGQICWRGASL